jgi:hypothetical protein
MPTEDSHRKTVRHWQECRDVYDFLEQIRLRPGMWLSDGSLRHLQAILFGYRVALGVHAIDEPFDFWPEDDFTQWLREHHGISSSLGWAAEIERRTPTNSKPVDEFFRLLDDFRRGAARELAPDATTARLPGIEAEFDRRASRCAAIDLGQFVVGSGEADSESLDLSEPAFPFGLGGPVLEVVANLHQPGALGRVGPEKGAAHAGFSEHLGPFRPKVSDL